MAKKRLKRAVSNVRAQRKANKLERKEKRNTRNQRKVDRKEARRSVRKDRIAARVEKRKLKTEGKIAKAESVGENGSFLENLVDSAMPAIQSFASNRENTQESISSILPNVQTQYLGSSPEDNYESETFDSYGQSEPMQRTQAQQSEEKKSLLDQLTDFISSIFNF